MEILDRVAEVLTHQNIRVYDNIRNSREIVVGISVLETTIKMTEDFKTYKFDFSFSTTSTQWPFISAPADFKFRQPRVQPRYATEPGTAASICRR